MMSNEEMETMMELRELNNDLRNYKAELENQKKMYANLLRNEMGDDIKEVLSGNRKISIPLKDRISFKLKCFISKIFSVL